MPSKREIFYSDECEIAAKRLGGYEVIDCTLEPIIYALWGNPYAFPLQHSDWFEFRYIVTKPIGLIPALVWIFTIKDEVVTMRHVEEYQGY